jgi:aldose 1-epimerase
MAAISDAPLIELSAGDLALGLVPAIGGSVAYFRYRAVDLMRPLSGSNLTAANVLGAAMFPMVPYANRIVGNAFDFGGRTWQFEANNPPERFNVHGTGWHEPWTSERVDHGALLSLDHIAPNEPYSFHATQHFTLAADGIRVTMGLTNRGAVAMPFGFGLHPWFDRDGDVELQFAASHFFMEGPEGVVTERLATPPELDFARGRPLPDSWRNNDYAGWSGKADIRYPSRGAGLRITADPVFGHLMLYADPVQAFFCVEPQSNAPCAFNHLGTAKGESMGSIVLQPGESAQGTISFLPFSI